MERANIPSPIHACLIDIHDRYRTIEDGKVADYIPELGKVNPDLFGICLATADGAIYEVGDSRHPFTIQSISKAFVYGLALADRGMEAVLRKVGVEPTGEAFNSIVLDEVNNRPYNPMVNAGAIATTALISGSGYDDRFRRILELFERLAGRSLGVDEEVYRSEKATGHRNRAIAYLELNAGMIGEPIEEHLDLYFRQCSILVNARDLAIMAATLANNGLNPLTRDRCFTPEEVGYILSVMTGCGMYDYSGEWLYRIGLPAKSGVGGGIIAVLPGQFGIGVFSPPLDDRGNSVRGTLVCRELSERYRLHLFDTHAVANDFVDRIYLADELRSPGRDLERSGSRVLILELRGDLYFATIEKLNRSLATYPNGIDFVILDGRRIGLANSCALNLLEDTRRWLANSGSGLLMAGFSPEIYLELKDRGWTDGELFPDLLTASEWCENHRRN